MIISTDALSECEPLYVQFTVSMALIREQHWKTFNSVADQKTLTTETLRVLSSYSLDRSRGAYCLLVNGLVWDAEIVLRSVYECFAKIMLIAHHKGEPAQAIVQEFWNDLSAIYDRKGAERSYPAENLAGQEDDDARVFRALRDEALFSLDPVGIKPTRKQVEQRWSFSGIIDALTRKGGIGEVLGLDALGHAYSMSSHLAHASPKAFDLMEDRSLRGEDLQALEVSHVCRILSDMVSLNCFGIYYAERAWKTMERMPRRLDEAFRLLHDATKPYKERFARSQVAFYADLQSRFTSP
jgi:hypothetical protein